MNECTCGIERDPDYAAIRERHGVETHSPYCPVGKAERELECLDGPEGCRGDVQYRLNSDRALTDGKPFPRCEAHFERRERSARETIEAGYLSDTVPRWFDPAFAGERWEEDV